MHRFALMFLLSLELLRADTVLVLPFFNQSKSSSLDWMGESIAESIRESVVSNGVLALDRVDRLEASRRLLIRPTAILTKASVIKLGETVDASQVIYGQYDVTTTAPSNTTAKMSLRITSRILDLKRIREGPELSATGPLEELATLETRLGWQVLSTLSPKTAPSEKEFLQQRPAVRLDALENYVRGLLASGPEQKHRFFAQAARLDARFSQPCFQLGKINWERRDYSVAAGWLERVSRADSHYLESRFLLGLCRYHTGDFAGAERSFREVAAAVPLNEVVNNLGAAQSRLNHSSSVDTFRVAVGGDSADPDYWFNLGYALWKAGRFAEAADSFRAVLDRNPEDSEAVLFLGRCLKKDGPRRGDTKAEGRERLKTNYEENAYRQLHAELELGK